MVANIFTLLLAPFASKLVHYSRHSESLKNRKNSEIDDIFLQKQRFYRFQKFFKDSLCLEKLTNLDVKRCQKKRKYVSYQLLYKFFQKYFVVHERSAVKNSFRTYVWSKVDSCFLRHCTLYSDLKKKISQNLSNSIHKIQFYLILDQSAQKGTIVIFNATCCVSYQFNSNDRFLSLEGLKMEDDRYATCR